MGTRMRVAFGCHLIAISLGAIFGLVYLFRSEFMPYHARAVGSEWVRLEPRMQALLVGFLKATGGSLLGGSVAGGFILLFAFRRDARWAVWAVPLAGLLTSLSTLWASLYVQHHTSATTPWIASAIGCALFGGGLVLSKPWRWDSPKRTAASVVGSVAELTRP
jgi:hypothetical protein